MCQLHYHGEPSWFQMNVLSFFSLLWCDILSWPSMRPKGHSRFPTYSVNAYMRLAQKMRSLWSTLLHIRDRMSFVWLKFMIFPCLLPPSRKKTVAKKLWLISRQLVYESVLIWTFGGWNGGCTAETLLLRSLSPSLSFCFCSALAGFAPLPPACSQHVNK